jgi:hypothetical protein
MVAMGADRGEGASQASAPWIYFLENSKLRKEGNMKVILI